MCTHALIHMHVCLLENREDEAQKTSTLRNLRKIHNFKRK